MPNNIIKSHIIYQTFKVSEDDSTLSNNNMFKNRVICQNNGILIDWSMCHCYWHGFRFILIFDNL
jgi:hypothetical protein